VERLAFGFALGRQGRLAYGFASAFAGRLALRLRK
jgi:hypothetical protein